MKYLNQTLAYLFKYGKGKRFFIFFLLMLPSCAIFAYFFPLSRHFTFFFDYLRTSYYSWGRLWLDFDHSAISLSLSFVGAVITVFAVAYVATVITRHVRVGEFGFPKLLYSVNEGFFPALSVTIALMALILVTHTVYTIFLYMWMRLANKIFGLILSLITFLGLSVAVVYLISSLILWLPIMSYNGLFAFKAMGMAFYKSRTYQRFFFLPNLMHLGILYVVALGAHFTRSVWFVEWILNALAYTYFAVVTLAFSVISYCETESITREDLAKNYFGR